MNPSMRYDQANPNHRARSSQVYQSAKTLVPQFLGRNQGKAQFREILQGFKASYPALCDDSIGDPSNPRSPYWKHRVASALQGLKKTGVIRPGTSRGEWVLVGAGVQAAQPDRTTNGSLSELGEPQPTPVVEAAPAAEARPSAQPVLRTPPPASDVQRQLLGRLHSLPPAQFEHFVARFLEAKGLANAHVTGRTGDGGVDGECEHAFLKVKVAFQAKRYAPGNNVGIEPVQRLRGSMSSGFDRGVFITTSSFTPAAHGWVEETRSPITLLDGNELVTEMVEMGLGMTTIPVVETQIDEEFFNALGS